MNQFGADDPDALLRAASLAKPHCDAIDLNLDWLGAKKRRNLDAPYDHWPSVLDLVRKICSILPGGSSASIYNTFLIIFCFFDLDT